MAANDPTPPVAGASRPKPTQPDSEARQPGAMGGTPRSTALPVLSAEDAELFASRIRPSWELFDDDARADVAADLAKPAGAPPAGAKPVSDTVIDGVPTFAIGDDAAPAEDPAFDPKARAVMTKGVTPAQSNEEAAPKPVEPAPRAAPPARGGKTRIGMGADEAPAAAAPAPSTAASSRRAVRTTPVPSAAKPAAATPVEDDIEIPVTGASKGMLVKIGLGAVALIGVAVIGYGVLGGSKKTEPTAPTATATAVTAAPTTPPSVQPPPTAEPPPAATATATAAPSATATATASAKASAAPREVPKPEPKKAEPKPEPKPEPKKAAAPPPAKTPANPPAKKGGGIIRETPF